MNKKTYVSPSITEEIIHYETAILSGSAQKGATIDDFVEDTDLEM